MRRLSLKKWAALAVAGVAAIFGLTATSLVRAEGEEATEPEKGKISISISPVIANFTLNSNSTYDGVMKVTNAGTEAFDFEVFSAPYSEALNETTNAYGPNFTSENNYTQIARWITVKDAAGNYVASTEGENSDENATHPVFSAAPGETIDVAYRITTPDNIPAGGQYATLFARTMPKESEGSGINALASLGMKIFGRSDEGEAIQSAEISNITLAQTKEIEEQVEENGTLVNKKSTVDRINGSALVKNTGNLDFSARGVLTVTSIFGGDPYYQTPDGQGQIAVIPDSEQPVSDEWTETPSFGLFKATYKVTAADETKELMMVVFLIPPFVIVLAIILLTIIIVSIILVVRRRKERRSRFTV